MSGIASNGLGIFITALYLQPPVTDRGTAVCETWRSLSSGSSFASSFVLHRCWIYFLYQAMSTMVPGMNTPEMRFAQREKRVIFIILSLR